MAEASARPHTQIPLLRLLQLASPALPIGTYAFSRGLEQAVEFGWVRDEEEAHDWIDGILTRSAARMDGPVLLRLHAAFLRADSVAAEKWNAFLCAARETREIALEDRQLGGALARVLLEQGVSEAERWKGQGGHVTLFALACARWQIGAVEALSAFLFGFAENQVSCAVKLVPLGQSAGQRILSRLVGRIDALLQLVLSAKDEELGSYAHRLALASACHETQYTRLFRS